MTLKKRILSVLCAAVLVSAMTVPAMGYSSSKMTATSTGGTQGTKEGSVMLRSYITDNGLQVEAGGSYAAFDELTTEISIDGTTTKSTAVGYYSNYARISVPVEYIRSEIVRVSAKASSPEYGSFTVGFSMPLYGTVSNLTMDSATDYVGVIDQNGANVEAATYAKKSGSVSVTLTDRASGLQVANKNVYGTGARVTYNVSGKAGKVYEARHTYSSSSSGSWSGTTTIVAK